jgi:hypothetical protein
MMTTVIETPRLRPRTFKFDGVHYEYLHRTGTMVNERPEAGERCLKFSVYYSKGDGGPRSEGTGRRGIFLSLTPITWREGLGGMLALYGDLAMSGAKMLVCTQARRSDATLVRVAASFDTHLATLAAAWQADPASAFTRLREILPEIRSTLGLSVAA